MRAEAVLLAVALLGLAGCSPSEGLEIDDARLRALVPGQDKTVAYFDLHNPGPTTVTLIGAEAEEVRAIEIHTTHRDGEIMRMRRLPEVAVPPGATIRFQPGGHHLMLFGVRSLREQHRIRLFFADGHSMTVPFRRIEMGGQ